MLRVLKQLRWFQQKNQQTSSDFCCLNITATYFSLAYVKNKAGKPFVEFIEVYPYQKETGFEPSLKQAVKKHDLEGKDCAWVLTPENYQLLLLDALPVTAAEFQAAIRWKIKGMLQFPVEDAFVLSFPMPIQKTHDPHEMILVAAAKRSYVESSVNKINECGLNVKIIDIQEMTLRNITTIYETDEKTTAFIYLRENSSELIITSQKQIYFQRHLELALSHASQIANLDVNQQPNEQLDKAALEIQRSFDYYQGQWRQPAPARIFLASAELSSASIAEYLSARLAMPIEPFDIGDDLATNKKLTIEMQGRCLPIIGEILKSNENPIQHINFVNLFPKKNKFSGSFEQLVAIFGVFIFILFFNFLINVWQHHKEIKKLNVSMNQLKIEQKKFNTLIARYPILNSQDLETAMQTLQKELGANQAIIMSLSSGNKFSTDLKSISLAYSPGAWLTEIIIMENGSQIHFKGMSIQASAVDQFLNQLIKQPVFASAELELRELTQAQAGNNQYLNFYIASKAAKR